MYANLPTAASLAYLGLGLAADASQAIAASESARQAILIGVGDSSNPSPFASTLENLESLLANAPQVLSLNGSSAVTPAGGVQSPVVSAQTGQTNSATMVPTMPQPAPRPVGGVFLNPSQPKAPVQPSRKIRPAQAGPPGCGFSGYPPPWSDAFITVPSVSGSAAGNGLPGWLVAAGLAVGGVVAISSRKRRGR